MNTIAQNMLNILRKKQRKSVWYGDIEIIEECARISGVTKQHPRRTINIILNGLEASPYFSKKYIFADISGKQRRYRCFVIKEIEEN